MKVALVYDRVNKWGGAERVLLVLHEMFPEAPLYTSIYNPKKAEWAKVFPKVIPTFLQKIPYATDKHEHFPYLMPVAFESHDFTGYDLVISVTSEAAKGVITKPPTKHICYCLTPTRYLWSGYSDYFKKGVKKTLSKPAISYLRKWDVIASQRPDKIISISSEVQRRIKRFYKRNSIVIYPPNTINSPKNKDLNKVLAKKDYYLVVSRLVGYKRVDLAIKVFNKLGKQLVIVGTGKEEKGLKKLAKDNIQFVGQLTDDELVDYYDNTRAIVLPQREDFGLIAVEAQSFGKPVVAFKAGGALDIVIENETGVFFNKQSETSLTQALKKFEEMDFNSEIIRENAKRFSSEIFKKELLDYINKL